MTHNKHYYYARVDSNNIGTIVTACSKKQMKSACLNLKHEWVRYNSKGLAETHQRAAEVQHTHYIDVTGFNY